MQQLKSGEFTFVADSFVENENEIIAVTNGQESIIPKSIVDTGYTITDYTPPAPVPEPPAPELRYITKLAFRNRFTTKEKVMIELAGSYNPADPIQKQQLAATVRVSDKDIEASTYIDLDRPDTRAGVKSMEDFGLLAEGRADEILDNPVQDFERYKG